MIHESPSWQLWVALGMLLLGAIIGGEALQSLSSEDDSTVARPLRSRAAASPDTASRPARKLAASLVFITCGVGLGLYGFRQLRRQGSLLRDGVPVMGRITSIHHERKRSSRISFRFEDEHGVEHQGFYDTLLTGGPFDGYEVGQEVTVIYEPTDPSKHMLDVDNVRRAEAAVRRL